jgi:hypothetical protein
MTDDIALQPAADEFTPTEGAEVPPPAEWEFERARQNFEQEMLEARGRPRHFVTADGVLTYHPLHEDMTLIAADNLRAKAKHPDEHPHIAQWYNQAARWLEANHAQRKEAAEEAELAQQSGEAPPQPQAPAPAAAKSGASDLPAFVRDWWNGLGADMRKQANSPNSELWRQFAFHVLSTAPLALRAPAGRVAPVEGRPAGASESGPWDPNFDLGRWRDANPLPVMKEAEARAAAEAGQRAAADEASGVTAQRQATQRRVEKIRSETDEPGISYKNFKKVLATPKGMAAAGTVVAQPVIPVMQRIVREEREQKEQEQKLKAEAAALLAEEEALLALSERDPQIFKYAPWRGSGRTGAERLYDIQKARGQ